MAGKIILRFRGRDGQFRLTVPPDMEFPELLPQIMEKLPAGTVPASVTLNNQPHGGDARHAVELKGVRLSQVGLT